MTATSDHRFSSLADARAFALAGNATITLQSLSSGQHYTYKIQAPGTDTSMRIGDDARFVKLLVDGDQWIYLGMIKEGGFVLTRASKLSEQAPAVKAIKFFFLIQELHPQLIVRHEGTCGRCGRKLTHPESIDRGIGPDCAAIMGIEVSQDDYDAQCMRAEIID